MMGINCIWRCREIVTIQTSQNYPSKILLKNLLTYLKSAKVLKKILPKKSQAFFLFNWATKLF